MSGILGILNLDGAPAAAGDLAAVAALLERRGPDRTGLWSDGPAGLGHTLLTTTPELAFERQPVEHPTSGCVITADVRLDNRDDLLAALHLTSRAAELGDAGLILEAYLAWGEDCASRLMGDFAFAIWDPRTRAMFCARDAFGLRPLYYHHAPGHRFVFSSGQRAMLVLPQVPCQVNEGRIADYLIAALERIDYTSTFFAHIFRLPPACALTVTPQGLHLRRYWTLEPGPELRLPSNEAYAEALLEVLTAAVRSRLRGAGPVGATLSGGLDSGSVVAIATGLLSAQGQPPLPTFSGVGPSPETCVETRAIHEALTMGGLDPHLVDYTALDGLLPELDDLLVDLDEPFDSSMMMLRCMYLTARRQGIRVLIDGAGSDAVLSEGTHVSRLFQQGHWLRAVREARGLDRFFQGAPSFAGPLRAARVAFTPGPVRRLGRRLFETRRAAAHTSGSIISPAFAERISLVDRLRTLAETCGTTWQADYRRERVGAIVPSITAGRERYNRVASPIGGEPRDPFLDRRVVAFCVSLPGSQRLDGGWPKVILRRAMAGRLPDAVRWRRGKEHLGWSFIMAVMKARGAAMAGDLERVWPSLRPFVDRASLEAAWRGYFRDGNTRHEGAVYAAASLAAWLRESSGRPRLRPARGTARVGGVKAFSLSGENRA